MSIPLTQMRKQAAIFGWHLSMCVCKPAYDCHACLTRGKLSVKWDPSETAVKTSRAMKKNSSKMEIKTSTQSFENTWKHLYTYSLLEIQYSDRRRCSSRSVFVLVLSEFFLFSLPEWSMISGRRRMMREEKWKKERRRQQNPSIQRSTKASIDDVGGHVDVDGQLPHLHGNKQVSKWLSRPVHIHAPTLGGTIIYPSEEESINQPSAKWMDDQVKLMDFEARCEIC